MIAEQVTAEDRARQLGDNPKQLLQRLKDAKKLLTNFYLAQFGPGGKFDFENKRLIGNNGLYLQWQLRTWPNKPESYENQQTNRGNVALIGRT